MLKYRSQDTGLTGWQELGLITFLSFWLVLLLLAIYA